MNWAVSFKNLPKLKYKLLVLLEKVSENFQQKSLALLLEAVNYFTCTL